jgi:hypothetical protein
MATLKVGGEVDAFCTKCKMTLAHTILAMLGTKVARVRCNTCGGDHAYRSAPGTTKRSSPSASRSPKKVVISFEQQLAAKDVSKAKSYSPKVTFVMDEVVNHPTFGLGIVTGVRGDKVDIAFKGDQKSLIQGRGDTASTKPAFSPPASPSTGPADKPMSDADIEAAASSMPEAEPESEIAADDPSA